jgi:hypothetical protein
MVKDTENVKCVRIQDFDTRIYGQPTVKRMTHLKTIYRFGMLVPYGTVPCCRQRLPYDAVEPI